MLVTKNTQVKTWVTCTSHEYTDGFKNLKVNNTTTVKGTPQYIAIQLSILKENNPILQTNNNRMAKHIYENLQNNIIQTINEKENLLLQYSYFNYQNENNSNNFQNILRYFMRTGVLKRFINIGTGFEFSGLFDIDVENNICINCVTFEITALCPRKEIDIDQMLYKETYQNMLDQNSMMRKIYLPKNQLAIFDGKTSAYLYPNLYIKINDPIFGFIIIPRMLFDKYKQSLICNLGQIDMSQINKLTTIIEEKILNQNIFYTATSNTKPQERQKFLKNEIIKKYADFDFNEITNKWEPTKKNFITEIPFEDDN